MGSIRIGSQPPGFGKNRIENLTDAIFAIALTLLVLGVEVPSVADETVPAAKLLVSLFPDFFNYILAFVVLAFIWVFHHQQFHHLQRIDRTMLWLNIISLMFITMVPFSSDFADTYYAQPVANVFFSANLIIIGLLNWLQWEHATKDHRLVSPHLDPVEIVFEREKNLTIPVLGVFAIALSLAGIAWAVGVFYLLPLVLFFLQRRDIRNSTQDPGLN